MGFGRWIGPGELLAIVERLAIDEATSRDFDKFGRMHVESTPISKACVNPYRGKEIPKFKELGLDPDQIYYLLRDPDELKKAAPTFNNLPILSTHKGVHAGDHQPQLVVGSTGTHAEFDDPHLRNHIVIWAGGPIDDVEKERKKELSSSYSYDADMTPGNYKGVPYHGVMRNIVGNHVAIVKEGRAGHDVVVGDSMEGLRMSKIVLSRIAAMTQGALAAYVLPKLAADAQINLQPVVLGLTRANFKDRRSAVIADLKRLTTGKLAKDAKIDDVTALLDRLEKEAPGEAEDETDPDPAAAANDEDEETPEEKAERLRKRGEDKKAKDAKIARDKAARDRRLAGDETPEEKAEREKQEKAAEDKAARDAEMANKVDKTAMDAAIKAATKDATEKALRTAGEIREAFAAVRPYVGELAMDSAVVLDPADVFRGALKVLGEKEVDSVFKDSSAAVLKAFVERHPKISDRGRRENNVAGGLAMDAAAAKSFDERFPGANKIRVMAK